MFQPLAPFTKELLDAFKRTGRIYFVRQSWRLAGESPEKHFIFSHYTDPAFAWEHFGALENELYRAVYDASKKEDFLKLMIAADQPKGYCILSALFKKNWQHLITKELEADIRRYIDHLGWKPTRNDLLNPKFYLHYGHLYLELRFKSRQVRVKFEDLKNLAHVL